LTYPLDDWAAPESTATHDLQCNFVHCCARRLPRAGAGPGPRDDGCLALELDSARDAKADQVIGSSRYFGYNEEKSEIEIGWTFLARSHWGGVYNGEMKQLMLQHAFKFVNNVVFLIGPQNFRSQKAVEKIGGVPTGSRIDTHGGERVAYTITAAGFRFRL